MFEVTVNTRRAVVGTKELITTSSAGIQCQFTFSEDWDELSKIAIFRNGDEGQEIPVALPNSNLVEIPAQSCYEEYVDEPIFVGVYGTDGLGAVIIPTVWVSLGVLRPGAVTTGIITPAEPTPDMWGQILAIANNAAAIADECETQEEQREAAETVRGTAEEQRAANETSRQSAEETRAAAEENRGNAEQTRVTAENSRVSAESARVEAEILRAQAETLRQQNETSRATAETERASAEQTRQSQESTRASNETARISAEQGRASAESSRVTAETNRVSAESSRALAETSRASAEQSRATAETARASAESSRATAEQSRANAEADRVSAEAARVTEFAGLRTNFAPEYDSTATYAVGDLVLHEGVMYECNTAITTAEEWTAGHWTQTKVSDEVADLTRQLNDKITSPTSPASGAFLVWNGSAWVAQTLATWQGGNY